MADEKQGQAQLEAAFETSEGLKGELDGDYQELSPQPSDDPKGVKSYTCQQ